MPVHTDAAQSVGKVVAGVDDLHADLLTVVGHKMYAPTGVGALYVRPGTQLVPLVHGGGQERGLRAGTAVPGLVLNGPPGAQRLPNTLNVSFPRVIGAELLAATPEIAASTGAACHSGDVKPSATLLAMGVVAERAAGAVRLSLGRWTTAPAVDLAADLLARRWASLRQ